MTGTTGTVQQFVGEVYARVRDLGRRGFHPAICLVHPSTEHDLFGNGQDFRNGLHFDTYSGDITVVGIRVLSDRAMKPGDFRLLVEIGDRQ